MARVEWTLRALDDLHEIHDFISRDSPQAAAGLVERIFASTDRLALFPQSGRIVPEFPALPYREIIVSSYRVLYRLENDRVLIAAVVHGRRSLEIPP